MFFCLLKKCSDLYSDLHKTFQIIMQFADEGPLHLQDGAQQKREMEGNLRKLTSEKDKLIREYHNTIIKTREEISSTSSDEIKENLSFKGKENYDKAIVRIEAFQQTVENFKIEIEIGAITATQVQLEVLNLIEWDCENLKEAVRQTKKDIIKEGENRNIRNIDHDQDYDDLLEKNTPSFSGYGSLHVYIWIRSLEHFFKQRGILRENTSLYMKRYCVGDARKKVALLFTNTTIPEPESVKERLIMFFGDPTHIFHQIRKDHIEVGRIQDPSFANADTCHHKVLEHLNLLSRAKALVEETAGSKVFSVIPSEIQKYSSELISKFPSYWQINYLKREDSTGDVNDILNLLKEELEEMGDITLKLRQRGEHLLSTKGGKNYEEDHDRKDIEREDDYEGYDEEEEEEEEEEKEESEEDEDEPYGAYDDGSNLSGDESCDFEDGNGAEYEDDEEEEDNEGSEDDDSVSGIEESCEICSYLYKEYGKITSGKHAFKTTMAGNQYVKLDSCPHIVDKDIPSKIWFCKSYNICIKCLTPMENGDEDDCTFLSADATARYRCSEPSCDNRLSTCPEHKDLNEGRLRRLRYDLANQGCILNF